MITARAQAPAKKRLVVADWIGKVRMPRFRRGGLGQRGLAAPAGR